MYIGGKSHQGADFKNNQTTNQLNNSIWAHRKVETKLYLLPIGQKKIKNPLPEETHPRNVHL